MYIYTYIFIYYTYAFGYSASTLLQSIDIGNNLRSCKMWKIINWRKSAKEYTEARREAEVRYPGE